MIGSVLGSYRVTEKIGTGGMGEVYSAEHTLLGKTAAIKVLRPELSANQTAVGRFFQEAKATSSIDHPGIVEVFDFGFAETGDAYLIMELLKGESLRTRLARVGRMAVDDALRIIGQVAGAVHAAHQRGIIHRDLKPDNIFLVADPDVEGAERGRVLDFGIAKLSDTDTTIRTLSGAVVGTPVYMAPEQCRGSGNVDHRADIYALGCILYECITGQRPFVSTGRGELLALHMFKSPVPLTKHVPSLDGNVNALVLQLLAKKPSQRPPSASDLVTLIGTLRTQRARPVGRTAAPASALEAATLDTSVLAPPSASPAPVQSKDDVDTTMGRASGQPEHKTRTGIRSPVLAIAGTVTVVAVVAIAAAAVWRPWQITGHETPEPEARPVAAPGHSSGANTGTDGRAAQNATATENNRWIRVTPPLRDVPIGIAPTTTARGTVSGLRASRKVFAPKAVYEIHQHEVTWGALEPWLQKNPNQVIYRPAWVPSTAAARAALPATGIPWRVAYSYCRSIRAGLPTEQQWEFAARGPERRPYSWGTERIDLDRTRVYAGKRPRPHRVDDYDQDMTPDPDPILGMMSNAREWTASLWREDAPGKDERWVQRNGAVYRVVRGLPIAGQPPTAMPREAGAFRDALCAAEACLGGKTAGLQYVGFRCARTVKVD